MTHIDISKLSSILHPLEKIVLPLLGKFSAFEDLLKESNLKDVELVRALQWLQNKNIVKLTTNTIEQVVLEENGKLYKEKGLPEDRFLNAINNTSPIEDILKTANLDRQEMSACLGVLKAKAAIEMQKSDKGLIITITEQGKKLLTKESLETQFLKHNFPLKMSELEAQEKLALTNLKKRKNILRVDSHKKITAEITDIGRNILKEGISTEKVFDRLTPGMLKLGSWKGKKFRPYDTEINVPKIAGGKKHFVNQAIDYIKRIWLDLGFEEMTGNIAQTSFWDLDTLFVPQDHPAREMQDTFFIKNPKSSPIPKELAKKIKAVHETGGNTGSKGWGGTWSEDIAKQMMLRTHTTVLSAHTLYKLKKEDLPKKFFCIGKVYRNETLDWKHLFEFYQVEGIVIDPDANLRNLFGYLIEFYKKLGYLDVRLRPAHFPYTEPSVEVEVLHPIKKEWIELGGAGIFRPEVSKILLGIDIPILAWGQGMERGVTEYFKISDLREIYKNDIKQLKEMKQWMKL